MSEDTLPDPGGMPVPASLPFRIARAGAYTAGALVLAAGGLVILAGSFLTRTPGATRSTQLVWEARQQAMAEAARDADLDNPDEK